MARAPHSAQRARSAPPTLQRTPQRSPCKQAVQQAEAGKKADVTSKRSAVRTPSPQGLGLAPAPKSMLGKQAARQAMQKAQLVMAPDDLPVGQGDLFTDLLPHMTAGQVTDVLVGMKRLRAEMCAQQQGIAENIQQFGAQQQGLAEKI